MTDTYRKTMSYESSANSAPPTILFVCIHNAGRSQMAAGWLQHLGAGNVVVLSGGTQPAEGVNPAAIEAMSEVGIDITANIPKLWNDETVVEADVIITMGCGDVCPIYPGKRYEDWVLEDPAGQGIDMVREVRDNIKTRVETLITSLDLGL